MNVQFIEHNGQRQYAVIPVEWYSELLEKAEMFDDIKAFNQAATTQEETIPHEIVCRLVKGENKLKVWREFRQLTQTQLAEKSGIAQANIVQIENGAQSGNISELKKLAMILKLEIDDLV